MTTSLLHLFWPALLLFLATLVALTSGVPAAAAEIRDLKKLYLDTVLVERSQGRAVIVAPEGGRYSAEVALLQQRIAKLTGVTLPVCRDDAPPEELLRRHQVIALGNMATNRFIGELYRQWRVILDLKYPGAGGYVVRSLHNPLGTGRNVIFLGGSDDGGVAQAARLFAAGLKQGKTLKVGWLQEIKLGQGITPPTIGAYLKDWQVQSWNDSRRRLGNGRDAGYPPATYFGWNPISIAGALYYMTGRDEYLRTFKELAMPDPRNLPLPLRNSDAFKDPADPLVKNYHYHAYLVDCVYDLIEESPLFADRERLFITNKLLEHQVEYEAKEVFSYPNGDRHALWHMLCIYTGSRYFSLYYPEPRWQRRLESVRSSFGTLIDNPTWGERDTLEWVATSIQPVFEFFLLDGDGDFVTSGTAGTLMKALEVLMTGREAQEHCYSYNVALSLLHQGAYLLKDARYTWMARRFGYDLDAFRIGLSYWPAPETAPAPPLDLVGAVTPVPLARFDRRSSRTPVGEGEGFQLLSYRGGLEESDDYFLLDGFEGLGRHPYQLNTLLSLRMFGGKEILSGYANDLAVWFNGMTGPHVARSAALKGHLADDGFAYVHTEVPDMPGSRWGRRLLYLKGFGTVVLDRILPLESGRFDVASYWQMAGAIKDRAPSRRIMAANGVGVVSADMKLEPLESGNVLRGKLSRQLRKDEPLTVAALFFNQASPKTISPLRQGGYLITGTGSALVGDTPFRSAKLSYQADFAYLDRDRVLLAGARELVINGRRVLKSDAPLTVHWRFREAKVSFSAARESRVFWNGGGPAREFVVPARDRSEVPVPAEPEMGGRIDALLLELEAGGAEYGGVSTLPSDDRGQAPADGGGQAPAEPVPFASPASLPENGSGAAGGTANWKPLWERRFPGKISALAAAGPSEGAACWAVSQGGNSASLLRLSALGEVIGKTELSGELLSLWPAASRSQARSFAVLAGLKDDSLAAFAADGAELWRVKSSLHPQFMIGERYDAPWFTDPRPPYSMSGVHSLLVGDLWGAGPEEIAVGRPCTVEFRALDGSFRGRVPTQWGTNSSLALLPGAGGATLLAGKNHTGIPALSGIDSRYRNVGDSLFRGVSPGFTDMHAWQQRGVAALRSADIDGDGKNEIVYTLSGHWNELRVYDASQKPLWMKSFGPAKAGGGLMTALTLVGMSHDGRMAVIVGTKSGWVSAFDPAGKLLWQRYFPSEITSMAGSGVHGKVVLGLKDGGVALLDLSGTPLKTASLRGAVQVVAFAADGVLAGTVGGQLVKLPLHP